jgi:hypothetical protein
MTDSPALHPLHSISLQFRRSPVRLAPAFPFHCVPTAANCRDSQEINRARPEGNSPLRGSRRRTLAALRVRLMSNRREREAAKIQRCRDAPHIGQQAIAHESLLAGKSSAIRREAPPVAEDKQ